MPKRRALTLDLKRYQQLAQETDTHPGGDGDAIAIPLLGLAGEAGTLLSTYKKHIRDKRADYLYRERIADDLGDVLWYVANIASKLGLDLADIAERNLNKTRRRFLEAARGEYKLYDDDYPENERFPRAFDVQVRQVVEDGQARGKLFRSNGGKFGDDLTDNSYEDIGYRFHDVFHLTYLAVLGWSPVMRKLMGLKRKSDKLVDEVEDGGRAIAIEEAISAICFDAARKHAYFEGVKAVDASLLEQIAGLTRGLEVSSRTQYAWQKAILASFAIWRQVRAYSGGVVSLDLIKREISFRPLDVS